VGKKVKQWGGSGVVVALLFMGLPVSTGPFVASAAPVPRLERMRLEQEGRSVKLRQCKNVEEARCGTIKVPLDREDPSVGKIDIFFRLYKRTDRSKSKLGTIVAVEGGPGYSSTGSASSYTTLFRRLMDRRNLLIVDNRGTGLSGAILCQPLQSYEGNYVDAVGKCGRQLGDTSDLYGSHNAADDLAAVLDALEIDQVDLYGDSYGTFFGQTFAVRHPDRLRSLVLDAAYFVGGTDPWYSDTNRAIRDAFRYVCERRPSCDNRPGSPNHRIELMAERLREEPIVGNATDSRGRFGKVTVDIGGLAYLVVSAASSPTIYRELDGAIRAALRKRNPYYRPLLRLAHETYYEGGAGPVRYYSEGLYLAVACNDYPQAYDMTATFKKRVRQYKESRDQLRATQPEIFAPFTIHEWVTAPVAYWDSCLKWPRPSRVDPAVPVDAVYPDVPTLVLDGDLDSLTSPEGAKDTAEAFPNSTYVEVANMWHVSALGDFSRCASDIVVRFVRDLDAGDISCAGEYNEHRLVDTFAPTAAGLDLPNEGRGTARVAAMTVADVIARWFSLYSSSGRGMHGGTFTSTGYGHIRFELDEVRWVKDVAVSGEVFFDRTNGEIVAEVEITGRGVANGKLELFWNDWDRLARAYAIGRVAGDEVSEEFLAP
jgi:pimeloyl-ACP methyl ester carboxylesterase